MSKKGNDSLYNFIIDYSTIREIQVENITSYTFKIIRENFSKSYFENLVIISSQNQIQNAYLLKYTQKKEIEYMADHNSISFEGKVNLTKIDLANLNYNLKGTYCTDVWVAYCNWSYFHVAGPTCFLPQDGRISYSLETICEDDGFIEPPLDTGNGGGVSFGGGPSSGGDGDIILTTPLEDPRCPLGSGKIKIGEDCVCKEGKKKDKNGICGCEAGKVEHINGADTCVKKPCEGDPVPNPEIAAQKGKSGIKGALYGNSSSGNCKRYGSNECSTPRNKKHDGIDLKNEQGAPIFAMFDGYIYSTKYHDKAGYNTRIHSTVNGKNILISYFHLQKNNRVLQTSSPLTYIKAGDIIGYQGDSGNLKSAIANGGVDSHVHIEVREHDGSNSWGYSHYKLVDPRDYLSTTIDDNGVSQANTNCK